MYNLIFDADQYSHTSTPSYCRLGFHQCTKIDFMYEFSELEIIFRI